MAINYPGPYECRFFYTTNEYATIAQHQFRLSLDIATPGDVGDAFDQWEVIVKNGTAGVTLQDAVEDILEEVVEVYHTSTVFSAVELWEYAPGTFDAVFRAAHTPTNDNGLSATATNQFSQTVITMRTELGGILKLDLRGTVIGPAAAQGFPTTNNFINDIGDELRAGLSPWVGRDGSFAAVRLRFLPGQNEHAFKKVNR